MARKLNIWYYSNMTYSAKIPAFGLFGEFEGFPDVVSLEALSVRAAQNDWRITPHRHQSLAQLVIVDNGNAQASADALTTPLTNNQFIFLPAMSVHAFTFEANCDGVVISIPSAVANAVSPQGDEMAKHLAQPFTGNVSENLSQIRALIENGVAGQSNLRSAKLVSLVHFMLLELADLHANQTNATNPPPSDRLKELDRLIDAHLEDSWTASHYADEMAMSTGHLSRLCRQTAGCGVTAYIEQRIMNEACRLLAFTKLPIAEIGLRLGFDDPSYFSKRFRLQNSKTPSQYRAKFTT